jgi:hypothetical protein
MDPVAHIFVRITTLEDVKSTENKWEALPTREATLNDARSVPVSTDPALHRTVVSDSHAVISHPVWDIDPDPETAPSHMPAPFNVKPAETAVPKFTLRDELTRAESTE